MWQVPVLDETRSQHAGQGAREPVQVDSWWSRSTSTWTRSLHRCVVGIKSRHSRTRARIIAACIPFRCACARLCAVPAGLLPAVSTVSRAIYWEYTPQPLACDILLSILRKRVSSAFSYVDAIENGGRPTAIGTSPRRRASGAVQALFRVRTRIFWL